VTTLAAVGFALLLFQPVVSDVWRQHYLSGTILYGSDPYCFSAVNLIWEPTGALKCSGFTFFGTVSSITKSGRNHYPMLTVLVWVGTS
jgi:hypothetical protein